MAFLEHRQETSSTSTSADMPSLDVVFDLTREQLIAQQAQGTALDTKAAVALGSASFLTGGLVSYRPSPNIVSFPPAFQSAVHYIPAIAVAAYVIVVITAFMAFSLRRYQRGANPSRLFEHYLTLPDWKTKGMVTRAMVVVYQRNKKLLRAKVWWSRAALAALAFEALVIFLMLVIQYLA